MGRSSRLLLVSSVLVLVGSAACSDGGSPAAVDSGVAGSDGGAGKDGGGVGGHAGGSAGGGGEAGAAETGGAPGNGGQAGTVATGGAAGGGKGGSAGAVAVATGGQVGSGGAAGGQAGSAGAGAGGKAGSGGNGPGGSGPGGSGGGGLGASGGGMAGAGGAPGVAGMGGIAGVGGTAGLGGTAGAAGGGVAGAGGAAGAGGQGQGAAARKVIIFVWDGLRPDSVSAQNTPNLARLRDQLGANFTDNHAVFPTFTMMNASAFATGSYPGTHGFYGNTEYQPGPTGPGASGVAADFTQPIFTEDYGILRALDGYYTASANSALFLVDTLFQAAHRKGLKTAAVGKSGPAFIQDYREDGALGVILDENIAFPATFAQALQASGYALPANAVHYPFATGTTLTLSGTNGDPTATVGADIVNLADARTSDPRATRGSPHNAKNEYMMGIFTGYILPQLGPDLSLVWFRNPDSTEHTFGPGSADYVDALRDQDALLGQLQAELAVLGLTDKTDIIVVSDHGHSTVAGDPDLFPLRALTGAADGSGDIGTVDPHGYSVSGDIRSADLLSRAGLAHVYDGVGCTYDPVLSGIRSDGSRVYPTLVDTDGSVCGATGTKYSTASFKVPATVPTDAVIIAANGGSDYFYVPSHDPALVKQVVTALEQRRGYGAIFVRSAYGPVPGALALSDIKVEGATRGSPPTPDIIVSFDWNEAAVTAGNLGVPGTEYESAQNNRGMHGSFSPIDVHNTLIAAGPDFKARYVDAYPSGNVDVPVTVASLLGLTLPGTDGRVLREALAGGVVTYSVATATSSGGLVPLTRTCNPDDLLCGTPVLGLSYSFTLTKKVLTLDDGTTKVTYFDQAKATRQ